MKIRHNIEISDKDTTPFVQCKLEREPYAKVLTEILNTYKKGFVLAINNEWGTGKTTFVKMWQKALETNHFGTGRFQTIYFNAWENDFDNNPLVALMSELKEFAKENKKEKVFKSVLEKGAILAKDVLPTAVKLIAKKYIDVDAITDTIENVTKGATEIFKKEISEYANKKKTVSKFKTALGNFIKKSKSDKPLVFIIDELDRCRPDYAVEVLEKIKHFFSVEGIVFVLSIDKNHLASSIRGYYGSETINTDEYLRRFIDLEYSLPKPSTKVFCEYLFDYYNLPDYEYYDENKKVNKGYRIIHMAEYLFDKSNATLRQQEKILAFTKLLLSFSQELVLDEDKMVAQLFFLLVYFKTMENKIYERIKNKKYNLQKFYDILDELLPEEDKLIRPEADKLCKDDISPSYCLSLHGITAYLLYLYNNKEFTNFDKIEFRLGTVLVKNTLNNRAFLGNSDYLNNIKNLDYFLNRIDLTETIEI